MVLLLSMSAALAAPTPLTIAASSNFTEHPGRRLGASAAKLSAAVHSLGFVGGLPVVTACVGSPAKPVKLLLDTISRMSSMPCSSSSKRFRRIGCPDDAEYGLKCAQTFNPPPWNRDLPIRRTFAELTCPRNSADPGCEYLKMEVAPGQCDLDSSASLKEYAYVSCAEGATASGRLASDVFSVATVEGLGAERTDLPAVFGCLDGRPAGLPAGVDGVLGVGPTQWYLEAPSIIDELAKGHDLPRSLAFCIPEDMERKGYVALAAVFAKPSKRDAAEGWLAMLTPDEADEKKKAAKMGRRLEAAEEAENEAAEGGARRELAYAADKYELWQAKGKGAPRGEERKREEAKRDAAPDLGDAMHDARSWRDKLARDDNELEQELNSRPDDYITRTALEYRGQAP